MSRTVLLDLTEGDDYALTIHVTDETGTPVDVSAQDWTGMVRARASETSECLALFSFDVSGAATGEVIAYLAAADTATFPDRVAWDIKLSTGGLLTTWLRNLHQPVIPRVTVP